MHRVAVIVPTLRRPEGLASALASLMVQEGVTGRLSEIVVVDNDREPSARTVAESFQGQAFPVVYAHEPTVGVASARNAGLAATDAPLIAFLDDDEIASPGWLAALLATQASTGADVVFGPIRGRAPEAEADVRPYLEAFFGRAGPASDALIDHPFGCGNSLMVRATALPGPAPFEVRWDQSGGEDDALFAALSARGGRYGWSAAAWVDEVAPAHRANLGYALSRAFAFGQSPSQAAWAKRDMAGVVKWMAVGALQLAGWGLVALPLTLLRRPGRARALDRAVRGLGKILWMPGLEPRFYGASELQRLDRAGT
jgi:hypothetical protein